MIYYPKILCGSSDWSDEISVDLSKLSFTSIALALGAAMETQPLAPGVPYDPGRRQVFGQMDNHDNHTLAAPDAHTTFTLHYTQGVFTVPIKDCHSLLPY